MTNIKKRRIPYWTVLSEVDIKAIHDMTVKVMQDIGVAVNDDEALLLLKNAGADIEGNVVKISAELLAHALDTAPSSVTVYDRNGKPAMLLEQGYSYFGPGSDTTYTINPETGVRKHAGLDTIKDFARLADALPNIDFTMSMGIAPEVDSIRADKNHFLAMVENTTKPVLFTAQTPQAMKDIIEICSVTAGGTDIFRLKPFAVLYAMPTAPLIHTHEALQDMMLAADAGIPCIYASGAMNGATGPVTSAGILVSSNAEMLTGLVIHQLRKPGAPFVYGATLGPLEMKTMVNIYCGPESMQMQIACIQLGRFYDLPTFATGGCSDSKLFDQQAAAECSLSLMTTALSGGGLIHDVGYLESGLCSSMEALVFADEMIGQIRFLLNGFDVNEDTMAFDAIKRVGIGGHYLHDDHTLENYRDEVWYPELIDHRNYKMWQESGGLDMGNKIKNKTLELLKGHKPQLLSTGLLAELRRIAEK
jgi:trimethylamine--corrinoid protein Co-methyltransferase